MYKQSPHKGFTLIEMLIVIVIIGVLAAALIPRVTGIQARARDTARTADMRNTATALEVYHLDNGSYPSANYAFIQKKPSPLLSSLFIPTTFAQTPGGSSLDKIDAAMASYMTALPKDPNGLGVQANVGGDCLVQGSSYAYYTDPAGGLYAITATKESKRGNANSCNNIIDSNNQGAYEKIGKGLTTLISQGGSQENIYPGEDLWIPIVCFRSSNGAITYFNKTCTKDVIIPAKVMGVDLTAIGDNAFEQKQLISLTLPDSLISIGEYAFRNNNLTSLTIPNSVISIGKAAFFHNLLTSITIPDSVTTIGDMAFANNLLTSVNIGNFVVSIGSDAFYDNKLTSLTIPHSVKTIGRSAFENNLLNSVTIPDSLTSIGIRVFTNNKLASISLPNYITSIGGKAFADNLLTSIIFSTSLRSIGDYAFENNLLISLTLPDSLISIGEYAFRNNNLTSLTIPNSVTTIGGYSFYNNKLTSVTIPNSVTSIGRTAFYNNNLTSVTIPDSITTILDNTFAQNNLISVTIPNSVTSIGSSAFQGNGPGKNSYSLPPSARGTWIIGSDGRTRKPQ